MATKSEKKYIETIGRRKTAIARARITPSATSTVVVNDKDVNSYFATDALRMAAVEPFLKVTLPTQFTVSVHVVGGGPTGQAEAVRHAISRGLVEYEETLRGDLKKLGFLKRDP